MSVSGPSFTDSQLIRKGYTPQKDNEIPSTLGEIEKPTNDENVCKRKIIYKSTYKPDLPDLGFLVRKTHYEICFLNNGYR